MIYIYQNQEKIIAKNNNIFLFHKLGIEIGSLDQQGVFIQKYIICYKSKEIFEYEKKYLISNSITKYISSRICVDNDYNNIQILMSKENENIGKLIVLKKNNNNDYKLNDKEKIKNKMEIILKDISSPSTFFKNENKEPKNKVFINQKINNFLNGNKNKSGLIENINNALIIEDNMQSDLNSSSKKDISKKLNITEIDNFNSNQLDNSKNSKNNKISSNENIEEEF